MNDRIKRALWRFLRAFVAGAAATMTTVTILNADSWNEIGLWLNALAISGVIGGVSGAIQAINKYARDGKTE